jgi:hypothetical protein
VSQYRKGRDGVWRLWFRRDLWNEELWRSLRARLAAERPCRHPRTLELHAAGFELPLFVKIFYRSSVFGTVKDCFRRSKAVRSLLLTERLAECGFGVPVAIAAGEERMLNLLRRSFVVTLAVNGRPLPVFLREQFAARPSGLSLRRKRDIVLSLAQEVKRLHDLGFVHGDLVPGNIFIEATTGGRAQFSFMDNDRTRRYSSWLRQPFWKRNLVQLNRLPLAGISLQDRMRFFHAYLGRDKLSAVDRELAGWLEQKTRQRRAECDAVDPSGSFRRLMRWDAAAH